MADSDIDIRRSINYPVAMNATNVIMVCGDSVEALQGAAEFELLDFAAFGQNLKVAIDRSQTDAGKAFADHLVDFISAGMGIHFAQFFQDNFALACQPKI